MAGCSASRRGGHISTAAPPHALKHPHEAQSARKQYSLVAAAAPSTLTAPLAPMALQALRCSGMSMSPLAQRRQQRCQPRSTGVCSSGALAQVLLLLLRPFPRPCF